MSRDSLSGLGILTRNSMSLHSRRGSNISLLAASTLESFHSVDDRNWSWSALRNTFRSQGLGDLYIRYSRRLLNAYFNVYLMLQISISVIYLVSILIINHDALEKAVPEATVHVLISISCITMFFQICDERVFRESPRAQIICSVMIVLLITGLDIGLSFYFYYPDNTEDRVIRTASAFQTLIIIYFFLPLPRKYQAILLGVLVSIAHLLASGVVFYSVFSDSLRARRTVADAIYYTCGNFVGVYSKLLSEITVRRAFLDRRGYIKSTIKKDYETKQEEQLLHSILPTHISAQVKQELMAVFQEMEESESAHYHNRTHRGSHSPLNQNGVMRKKPFSQLFVERHNDVTILFADIVNFTPLTVRLSAEDLVETLNQLFGRFDQAAKQYDCLRIKLLGDCYYCVSGLSNATPFHAKNCILLGLEMIEIIRGVREKLKVNVEMRIGVHSGNIISGLLGIYKWQYDIWSKDVTIANHMEQAGKPGKVHITRQTKSCVEEVENDFTFKRAFTPDKYLKESNIETYFVVPKGDAELSVIEDDQEFNANEACSNNTSTKYAQKNTKMDGEGNSISQSRAGSESGVQGRINNRKKFEKRLTDVTGDHVNILRSMWNTVDKQMEEAIDNMPLRKIDQWCGRGLNNVGETINHLFLNFNSWTFEKQFVTQPDPLFKYYIVCALLVLVCMGCIQALIMPSYHQVLWIAFCIAASYLLTLVPCVWVSFLWNRLKDPHREREFIPNPENRIVLYFYKMSNRITRRWIIRTIIYISVALVLSTFAIIDVIECNQESNEHEAEHEPTYDDCPNPWYFTYSCTLAILAIYGFFRINFLVKIMLCIFSITSYAVIMFNFRGHVFGKRIGNSPAVEDPIFAHLIYIIKIILLLHIMDRQMEYINRLDFIWKKKLTEEHKAASMTHATNAILIHNILPQQIAKIYLDPTRIGASYSRSYTDVSVMFASIPNFMDFYTETDLNDHGIKCLQLLNEIIVDFDNALFEFEDIEKIKVIGSTYMAACGLEVQDTGRMSNSSQSRYQSGDFDYMSMRRSLEIEPRPSLDKRRKTLVTLVKFAAVMMARLKSINKDAFQDFELRIGIDSGSIIAGVIGAQTPHYDIWGDTVNMASRMDSTGVNGKIQVAEGSALLLIQSGVKCQFRDTIKVKGKDKLIPTYFVKLDENLNVEFEDPNIAKRTDSVTTPYDDYY